MQLGFQGVTVNTSKLGLDVTFSPSSVLPVLRLVLLIKLTFFFSSENWVLRWWFGIWVWFEEQQGTFRLAVWVVPVKLDLQQGCWDIAKTTCMSELSFTDGGTVPTCGEPLVLHCLFLCCLFLSCGRTWQDRNLDWAMRVKSDLVEKNGVS